MPSAPRSGDTIAPTVTRPWPARPSRTSAKDGPAHLGVADDTALAHPGAARFELRFHQEQVIGGVGTAAPQGRGHRHEGDEGEIGSHDVDRAPMSSGPSPRTFALEHGDARVVAERPRQLAAAHVDRDDRGGARLEQAIGEATRRGTGVEGAAPVRIDREPLERGGQLLTPTRDEAGAPGVTWMGSLGSTIRAGVSAGLPPTRTRPSAIRRARRREWWSVRGAPARCRGAAVLPPQQDTRQVAQVRAATSPGASPPMSAAT